jgi:hypothetical protein
LEALLTEIFVLKDLAVDRGEQEGGGEGPYTRFELCLYMLRALRMSAPQHGIHGNSRSSATTPRRSISMPVWEVTGSAGRQRAMKMQLLGTIRKASYKLLWWLPAKTQTPNIHTNIPF